MNAAIRVVNQFKEERKKFYRKMSKRELFWYYAMHPTATSKAWTVVEVTRCLMHEDMLALSKRFASVYGQSISELNNPKFFRKSLELTQTKDTNQK